MICFFTDNHYDVYPGRVIYENLAPQWRERIRFFNDSWEVLESGSWLDDCELLVLHMIGGSCSQPLPGTGAEKAVKAYLDSGRPVLLLHGSSAAFWEWDFWREAVGLRWVRNNDPDGFAASTHPNEPYEVTVSKTRHPLARRLNCMSLGKDEIYTELEQTAPLWILMETRVNGRSYPQCVETVTPGGSHIVSFLPGHAPEITANPVLIENVAIIMEYLLLLKK